MREAPHSIYRMGEQGSRGNLIGRNIGNYRIVTELGSGAMGQVYFAEHMVMGRRAAIKVIREELSSNADMVQRFVNEARSVNRIGHPNIVEITDFGELDKRYYIMMEMLEGETLEERLERVQHLDEASALHIAMQVADALGAAHELGVVHRDLKPENIFLTRRGGRNDFVKVLDFGIAKLTTQLTPTDATIPGMILGTPHYMSPEQCYGDSQLDHRSDVYSLGIVLYRMLTGRLPFEGATLQRLLLAQIGETPPPPRDLNSEVTERTQGIILRTLEKNREHRFPDMRSLRAALDGTGPVQPAIERTRELASPAPELAVTPLPTVEPDKDQPRRVGSRLAKILLDRIRSDRLVLPSIPTVALQCLELLNKPELGLAKVVEAIGQDPIVAPQVIRRAHSALHGGSERVRTIEQAVSRLGARQLRALLVELSARRLFESRNAAIRKLFHELWEHSLAVAQVARMLALRRRDIDADAAYLAGLLHDVGKPVSAALLLEAERVAAKQAAAWLASDAWLGVISECHREVGVAMARSWNLPDDLVLAIARSARYSNEGPGSITSVVCFANALVKRAGIYPGAFDLEKNDALVREGGDLYCMSEAAITALTAIIQDEEAQRNTLPS